MSLDQAQDQHPLTSKAELERYLHEAERPRADHRVGLEHEKLVVTPDGTPVPYEGPQGICAVLEALTPHGYQPFRESPTSPVIALVRGMSTISLEPGGQLELSGSPFKTAREAHEENLSHVAEVKPVVEGLGLRLVSLGYRPFGSVAEMPWMPKSRYQVMRETLGKRGSMALNMMLMTATGQASFDWESEADCVRKTTLAARLAPVLVGLYANSPLVEGKPSGFQSFRSHVWSDVDKARCGFLPSWFDGSFSYGAYVEWALDAPILFLRRRGGYLQPQLTFRTLLRDGFEGKPALASDWVDHLSTLFPEVRIKRVLEIRSADCNSAAMTGALAAMWRGLLYDPTALAEAEKVLPKLSYAQHLALHRAAQEQGLRANAEGVRMAQAARDVVEVATRGLQRLGGDDAGLMEPLRAIAAAGRSPAESVLEVWTAKKSREAVVETSRL